MSGHSKSQEGRQDLVKTETSFGEPRGRGLIESRASRIAQFGLQALEGEPLEISLSEALVLGLLRQGVRKYFAIFGHGSTDLAEVLRIYEAHGLVQTFCFRNEVEMAHAATSLKWTYGETPAVVTSIGPGALQAMAGALSANSNGVGLYHLYGAETTWGEGYNMQQLPRPEQGGYSRLLQAFGPTYTLHTPEALREALRQGATTVFHPYQARVFSLLLPINTQPRLIHGLRLDTLPTVPRPITLQVGNPEAIQLAVEWARSAQSIVVKVGGGARHCSDSVRELVAALDGVGVLSPGSLGVLADSDPLNLHVGGSKGSLCGNYAMENAELLVVLGSRAVCQSDCSGIGYPRVKRVINLNGDLADAHHYNHSLALVGDLQSVLTQWLEALQSSDKGSSNSRRQFQDVCQEKKREWKAFSQSRFLDPEGNAITLPDPQWKRAVLTQPAAIHVACQFAKEQGAIKYFDAGDVQANGFQIAQDDQPFQTITESGASYMGFAASAVLAGGCADSSRYAIAFCGDGSFLMNPQVLVDAVHLGVHATVLVFDNRRMAAISSLQVAQYGADHATHDGVEVDYVKMANSVKGVLGLFGGYSAQSLREALAAACAHPGLSVVHIPVYWGDDPQGGMGAYGSWNVGPWVAGVQAKYQSSTI